MPSPNLAARIELTAEDLPYEPQRAALQVITTPVPPLARTNRPRVSLEFRRIATRDQGLRSFRVF